MAKRVIVYELSGGKEEIFEMSNVEEEQHERAAANRELHSRDTQVVGYHFEWREDKRYVPIPSDLSVGLRGIGLASSGLRVSIADYAPHDAERVCRELNELDAQYLSIEQAEVELQRIGVQLLAGRRIPGIHR